MLVKNASCVLHTLTDINISCEVYTASLRSSCLIYFAAAVTSRVRARPARSAISLWFWSGWSVHFFTPSLTCSLTLTSLVMSTAVHYSKHVTLIRCMCLWRPKRHPYLSSRLHWHYHLFVHVYSGPLSNVRSPQTWYSNVQQKTFIRQRRELRDDLQRAVQAETCLRDQACQHVPVCLVRVVEPSDWCSHTSSAQSETLAWLRTYVVYLTV